jgi:thiamine transport system ATP-binding protein
LLLKKLEMLMLQFEQVYYRHGDFTLQADFEVTAPSLIAVLGPSGAGKSTLLNIIAGFEPLAQGRVLIDGADVTNAPAAQRPVSMVFQDNNVFPHLKLWQNVALGIAPNLKLDDAQHASIDEALNRVGLSTLAQRKPADVSGGERQRVALARILVRPTKVLLLDEPFAALDPGLRAAMLDLVNELTRERKLVTLLVTHQPEEIRHAADAVIFVAGGSVRSPQATSSFFASRDAAIQAYLGRATSSKA